MRWGLVAAALLTVTVQTSPTSGPAPLRVTFSATGAASAHWDFGDGTTADGVSVEHTYAAGRWTAAMTDDTGSTQTVAITAYGLTLRGPKTARYGRRATFHGAIGRGQHCAPRHGYCRLRSRSCRPRYPSRRLRACRQLQQPCAARPF